MRTLTLSILTATAAASSHFVDSGVNNVDSRSAGITEYEEHSSSQHERLLQVEELDVVPVGAAEIASSSESSLDDTTTYKQLGFIAWYCFVCICLLTPFFCVLLFCIRKYRRAREEEVIEERRRSRLDLDISRIEANVQIFSEMEQFRRKMTLNRSMKKYTQIVTAKDLKPSTTTELTGRETLSIKLTTDGGINIGSNNCEPKSQRERTETREKALTIKVTTDGGINIGSNRHEIERQRKRNQKRSSLEFSSGCRICLEPFKVGDAIMHSINRNECCHVFHKDCIISWLVSRPEPICPCCRQVFAITSVTPNTSICSSDHFAAAMDINNSIGNSSTETAAMPDEDTSSLEANDIETCTRESNESESSGHIEDSTVIYSNEELTSTVETVNSQSSCVSEDTTAIQNRDTCVGKSNENENPC